jgi:hypothetical protein
MGCGCGKNKQSTFFMSQDGKAQGDPLVWGPILWRYMHCIAEKIGTTGNVNVDIDQARAFEFMLTNLSKIIPCTECQQHCNEYTATNPVPHITTLTGDALKNVVRVWLFNFHNAVRVRKGQPITIINENDCKEQYANCSITKADYAIISDNVTYAIRQGWVKVDMWRRWYINSEKLRIMLGNVIV